jgi:hypothetical protein
MKGQQHVLAIQQILKAAAPYTPPGKTYVVREWEVLGSLDNGPMYELLVKTLSAKPECQACAGWQGVVEEDEYRGVVKYKIPTPKQAQGQPPPPQQTPGVTVGVPPGAQPPKTRPMAAQPQKLYQPVGGANAYTLQEIEQLYTYCWEYVAGLIQTSDMSAQAAATATLFIAAQREHIKVPLVPVDEQPEGGDATPEAEDLPF